PKKRNKKAKLAKKPKVPPGDDKGPMPELTDERPSALKRRGAFLDEGVSGCAMPLADSECHQTVSEDVMNSFEEGYRHSISMIPNPLKPDSTHHGKHSYT
ncbi:unnamed protein product, partial [Symbiodinium sp. KB8]